MTTNTQKFDIVNGPGKFDLMAALFDKKRVMFTLSGPARSEYLVTAMIFGVQAEDGSMKSWNIEGQMYPNGHERDTVNFTGYYHSGHSKGYLTLDNPISEIGEILAYGALRGYQVKTPNR